MGVSAKKIKMCGGGGGRPEFFPVRTTLWISNGIALIVCLTLTSEISKPMFLAEDVCYRVVSISPTWMHGNRRRFVNNKKIFCICYYFDGISSHGFLMPKKYMYNVEKYCINIQLCGRPT